MPNLRPASKAISLRLPVALLERIKVAAHKRDVILPANDGPPEIARVAIACPPFAALTPRRQRTMR